MSKIRLNTEYRNKFFNKIKDVFFKEDTQEGEAFLQSREDFKNGIGKVFETTKAVVQRHNPLEDVETCRRLKRKYGTPLDVVAKDKCFFMAHSEDVDDEGEPTKTDNHFDFGLYGSLSGSEYGRDDEAKSFAYAYNREELLKANCNPDILIEQDGKDQNPHLTKYKDANDKYLGNDDKGYGKEWNDKYKLDLIGREYCRDRSIACTEQEFKILVAWKQAKGQFIMAHYKWIKSVLKQMKFVKDVVKGYKYLDEAIEFANESGLAITDAEIIRTNSTGLAFYNPKNAAEMLKSMKNKNVSREDKILARREYERKQSIN